MLFKNNRGQIAGSLKEGIYRKKVDSRKHKMKVYDGYGIDKVIFNQLELEGCTQIRLLEEDTGNIFSVLFSLYNEKKIEKTFAGQVPQVFLPLKYWLKEK